VQSTFHLASACCPFCSRSVVALSACHFSARNIKKKIKAKKKKKLIQFLGFYSPTITTTTTTPLGFKKKKKF
jgi:hypothetical protein